MLELLLPNLNNLLFIAGGVITTLLALLGWGKLKKRQGAKEFESKLNEKIDRKVEDAEKAGYREKRATDGLSDGDVLDRLRRRTDRWGGL